MIFRQVFIGLLMTSMLCAERQLTDYETTNAYMQASNYIAARNPPNVHIGGIEQTSMEAEGNAIKVNLVVDLPKPYGVVRSYYTLKVSSLGHNRYRTLCCIADTSTGDYAEQSGVSVNLGIIVALRLGKRR